MTDERRVGLIFPGGGRKNPEEEMQKYAPANISFISEPIRFDRIDRQGLVEMGARVEYAARRLATQTVDLIVFACTSGSFIKGFGYDQAIIETIERATGKQAVTTTTAVVDALYRMESNGIVMCTPYPDEVNAAEVRFLQESGFPVLRNIGLGITEPTMVSKVPFESIHDMVKRVVTPDADTVFISCTGLVVLNHIAAMEEEFEKTVITSNQATLWKVLQLLGIRCAAGPGRLFAWTGTSTSNAVEKEVR